MLWRRVRGAPRCCMEACSRSVLRDGDTIDRALKKNQHISYIHTTVTHLTDQIDLHILCHDLGRDLYDGWYNILPLRGRMAVGHTYMF